MARRASTVSCVHRTARPTQAVARLLPQAGLPGVSRRIWHDTTRHTLWSPPSRSISCIANLSRGAPINSGWRCPLHPIPVVLAVSGRGAGRLEPPHRALGHGDPSADRDGARRLVHAHCAVATTRRHSPLGSGLSIHGHRLWPAVSCPRHLSVDVLVGHCFDNVISACFFATLECEFLDASHLATPQAALRELFTWIEGWYNSRRRHSALVDEVAFTFELRAFPETAA